MSAARLHLDHIELAPRSEMPQNQLVSAAEQRAMVYVLFDDAPNSHYADDVAALDRALGNPGTLAMHVLSVPLRTTPRFSALTNRWDLGERQLGGAVRDTLLEGPLFGFGMVRSLYARPGRRTAI